MIIRAEDHIKNWKHGRIILVLMFGQPTVMHPVHLRRGQEPAHTSESDSDICMIEHSPVALEERYNCAGDSATRGVQLNQYSQGD